MLCAALVIPGDRTPAQGLLFRVPRRDPGRLPPTGDRRHSSRKELLGAMARQRLTGESAPSQTVEQEARFAGVTKRRYQQVLQATREELGLAPPQQRGKAAVQGDAEALDLERMLELQADTIEALVRAAGPATPCMPWASGTGGPPCCDSVAGVKPGRAPGVPTR